jgi:hypothetical protein
MRADLEDSFERYLAPSLVHPPFRPATPPQTNDLIDLDEKSSATPDFFVADENEPNHLELLTCGGVADLDPPLSEEGGNADENPDDAEGVELPW